MFLCDKDLILVWNGNMLHLGRSLLNIQFIYYTKNTNDQNSQAYLARTVNNGVWKIL